MAIDERAMELRAAATVRRVIQKVRLATPENVDLLEQELADVMLEQMEAMGNHYETLQKETDKAMTLGRKHVDQILDRRAKEQELAERPRELMDELQAIVSEFEQKSETMKMTTTNGSTELAVEEASTLDKTVKEYEADSVAFAKTCAEFVTSHVKELKIPSLPASMKAEWAGLQKKIEELKKTSVMMKAKVKAATMQAVANAKKKLLEEKKAELRDLVTDAAAGVTEAGTMVDTAEKMVEPFVKATGQSVDEMLTLATEVDEAVESAKVVLQSAKETIQPSDETVDPLIKAEVQAFLTLESKKLEARLGQFEQRLRRASNLVAQYRKEANKKRDEELVEGMKEEMLEKVKGAADAVESAEDSVTHAEKSVEPFVRYSKQDIERLTSLCSEAETAAEVAQSAMDSAKVAIRPFDESLDEDVKRQLVTFLSKETKGAELKFGRMQNRLRRAQNLVKNFRVDIVREQEEIRKLRVDRTKANARRILRHRRTSSDSGPTSPSELFALANESCSGTLSIEEFLNFFEAPESQIEGVDFDSEILKLFYASYVKGGEEGMSKTTFMMLSGSFMEVVKPTTLTDGLSISRSKVLKQVKPGDMLEALEGPMKDDSVGVQRVKVRALVGEATGWVTLSGNAGTVFVRECSTASSIEAALKKAEAKAAAVASSA